jgi:hypothetical protein
MSIKSRRTRQLPFEVDWETSQNTAGRTFCRLTWPNKPHWFAEAWVYPFSRIEPKFIEQAIFHILNRVSASKYCLRPSELRLIKSLTILIPNDADDTPSVFIRHSPYVPSRHLRPAIAFIQKQLGTICLTRTRLANQFYGVPDQSEKVEMISIDKLIERDRKARGRQNQPKVHRRTKWPTPKEVEWILSYADKLRKQHPEYSTYGIAQKVKMDYDDEVANPQALRREAFQKRSLATVESIIRSPKKYRR